MVAELYNYVLNTSSEREWCRMNDEETNHSRRASQEDKDFKHKQRE